MFINHTINLFSPFDDMSVLTYVLLVKAVESCSFFGAFKPIRERKKNIFPEIQYKF